MRLTIGDPHAPRPRRTHRTRTAHRRTDWAARRLRLALARLDALARDPERPYRYLFHERETGRLLFLRHRAKRGAFAGPDDRRDPDAPALPVVFPRPPAIPLPGPAIVGYCRACGADLFKDGDWCERCGGTTQNTESGQ